MIKSHFIWIPKTAGSSMYEIFTKYGCNRYNQPDKACEVSGNIFTTVHEHPLAALEKGWITQHQWDESFKFCFVRNPWARLLSHFYHCKGLKWMKDMSFEDFLNGIDKVKRELRIRSNPQLWWMRDKNGNEFVDFIGRYENINNDWKDLCGKLDIKDNLEVKNVTEYNGYDKNNWRNGYNPNTKKIVRDKYAEEIERFGYTF